ncbi:MAG TPA: hypothetical protein VHA34_07560 [Actinomycetes bacterium]|nr:hypothetical protein [Actinomycetes bacterium]
MPEFDDPEEESASITELALRDLAGRHGTNPEDMVIRADPAMAEAMRDEAMRRFMDRQQARQTEATVTKLDPSQTVLGRLAARRKAREEGREPDPEPEPTGRGLLGKLGQLPDEEDEEELSPLERRARDLARRREEMQHTSSQVFAMPTAQPQETGSPELATMAARLTGRAKFGAGSAHRAAEAAPSPQPAPRASAKKTAAKKSAKKAAAKKAAGKKVAAKKVAAKKVAGRSAPAKKAAKKSAQKSPGRSATAKKSVAKATKGAKATARAAGSKATTRARATRKR